MKFKPRLLGQRYDKGASVLYNLHAQAEDERRAVLSKIESGAYLLSARKCAICEGTDFDVLATQDRYGLPIQTAICAACGRIQTNPDMRDRDYRDFYISHYRNLYIAELVGSPADFFKQEYWRGQAIVRFVEKNVAIPKGSLVVEIGCGAGGILQAFAARGYRVIGTDLGAENLAYGRSVGLDLRSGDLFELELGEQPALILYSHVLEHIRDPGATLDQVRTLLGTRGYLYIEVPGVKSVRSNVFQGDFLRTFHLAHVYNFTLTTLMNLARKHGFELVAGNEHVRSIFKPGKRSNQFDSDYERTIRYVTTTEMFRPFFGAAFRVAAALRAGVQGVRRIAIDGLRVLGLYDAVRRSLR